jgi:hypothetical protein
LIGDSHAAHLWSGLATTRPNEDILQATAAGCKPVLQQSISAAASCTRLMSRIFEQVVFLKQADKILLSARWIDSDLPAVDSTLAALQRSGIAVTLYGPIAEYDAPLPWLLVRAKQFGGPEFVEAHRRHDIDELDHQMEILANKYGADYVSLSSIICPNRICRTMVTTEIPMLFDSHHLTREGSLFVAQTQDSVTRVSRTD